MGIRTATGKSLDEITLDAVLAGDLTASDLRIRRETLEFQASVAEKHGNPQLGENLRRAAELASLQDDEILEIYEALRPHRSSKEQLEALAERLEASGAMICAGLVREAASVYKSRNLLAYT